MISDTLSDDTALTRELLSATHDALAFVVAYIRAIQSGQRPPAPYLIETRLRDAIAYAAERGVTK